LKREQAFDGVRGVAFSMVLFMHGLAVCVDGTYLYLQGTGKYGVWLFFVLSSFLLTRNYLLVNSNKIDYILGRVFRILPLYYVYSLVYLLYGSITQAPSRTDFVQILIVQFGPSHLWTIPVEFYFYFVLFFIWLIPKMWVRDIVFASISLASTILLFTFVKDPNSTNTLWYLPSFFVGYALARVWEKIPAIREGSLYLSFGVLVVFVFLTPGIRYFVFRVKPSDYLMNMYLPLSILWALFMVFALKGRDNNMKKVLESKFLAL
jgi:peptidoglycan/LPS O-acetylase OafA/YrhL